MANCKVLKNGCALSFSDAKQAVEVLHHASVLIQDDRIAAIGKVGENGFEIPAGAEVVDVGGKIISPGFANTHIHSWQSVYRFTGPNITLAQYFDWFGAVTKAAKEIFKPNDVYLSYLEGYLEGLNGGVTSFLDHAHHNWGPEYMEAGHRAAVDSGARIWWCPDLKPVEGFPPEKQWEVLESIARSTPSSRVALGLGLDAVFQDPKNKDYEPEALKQRAEYGIRQP
jgi:cytosine/adenosine deaminase-related metal-dependent hydrolase